jgi:hypothetical protein
MRHILEIGNWHRVGHLFMDLQYRGQFNHRNSAVYGQRDFDADRRARANQPERDPGHVSYYAYSVSDER